MTAPPLTTSSDAAHRARVAVDYAIALGRFSDLGPELRSRGIYPESYADLIANADTLHEIVAGWRAELEAERIRARIAEHAAQITDQQESTT